jgi:hypothetical protein
MKNERLQNAERQLQMCVRNPLLVRACIKPLTVNQFKYVHRIVCINTHSSCRRRTVLGFFQRTCPVEFIDRWLKIWITSGHTARTDSSQLNSGDSETFRTATTGGVSVELIRVGLGSVIKLGLTISWIQSNCSIFPWRIAFDYRG